MSNIDEVKANEIEKETISESTEKTEKLPAKPVEIKILDKKSSKQEKPEDLFSDIFVKDDEFFHSKVWYYKDGKSMNVKNVTENFDDNHVGIKEFNFWCKYPNAIETEGLMLVLGNKISQDGTNSLQAADFVFVQIARLKLLLKKWDSSLPIKSLDKIDPYILKGMLHSIMEELGYKGLL